MESTYSDPALLAYSDARTEYTKQLCQFVVPAMFKFFMNLLEKSREEVGRETQKILFQFQTYLKEIPDWNMEKVSNEITQLERIIGCEYLEDLLTAVFIAHTKILTAIRISSKKNTNVQINVPKVERFLFKVMCETSNLFWKNTYLFRDDIKNLEKQQNYRHAELLVSEGISNAIRVLVPVKNILRECIINDTSADADADSDDDAATEEGGNMKDGVKESADASADVKHADVKHADVETLQKELEEHPVVKALLSATPVAEAKAEPLPPLDGADADTVSPILNIDEHPAVDFADYDTVFDEENSNLFYDPKTDNMPSPQGILTISDEPGTSLDEFDTIDNATPADGMALSDADFETL
jgi:hypothetical protein